MLYNSLHFLRKQAMLGCLDAKFDHFILKNKVNNLQNKQTMFSNCLCVPCISLCLTKQSSWTATLWLFNSTIRDKPSPSLGCFNTCALILVPFYRIWNSFYQDQNPTQPNNTLQIGKPNFTGCAFLSQIPNRDRLLRTGSSRCGLCLFRDGWSLVTWPRLRWFGKS